MRLPGWLGGGRADSAAKGEIKQLTDQFYVTLRANFARMKALDKKLTPDALQRLTDLLGPDRQGSWGEAYEIEQMLVALFEEGTLTTELGVRSLEARKTFDRTLADHYEEQMRGASSSAERQRGLLARLVNDLQWRYTVNEVKRRYSQEITSRTGLFFVLALVLFVVWTAYIVLSKSAFGDAHLLIFAALAGTWGATFSMLGGLKSRLTKSELDDMKLMRPWVMLLSRVLIGTGAGCVLYFFLRSGLLAGSAFPQLAIVDTEDVVPRKDLALLIIWCFIAGFSEKLVPSLLEKTEARAETYKYRPPEVEPGKTSDTTKDGSGNPQNSGLGNSEATHQSAR